MKKEELQRRIDEIKWFHRIDLPTDEGEVLTTPGVVDHTTEEMANVRYGVPSDLSGKTVLDIGAYDGYFSFLCDKRGAEVYAIDPLQGRGNISEVIGNVGVMPTIKGDEGFRLAKLALKSNVKYVITDLKGLIIGVGPYSQRGIIPSVSFREETETGSNVAPFDVVLYLGVLYHVDSPLLELQHLSKTVKKGGMAIIETAVCQQLDTGFPYWDFRPGFDGDSTNKWYPTISGLLAALKHVGFSSYEIIWGDGIRATVKAYK